MTLEIHKMILPENCYSSRLRLAEGLVIHYLSAYYSDPERWSYPQSCWDVLRKLRLSYDWMIAQNGKVYQLVPEGHRSWHAGRSMWHGRPDCNSWMAGIALLAAPQVLPDYGYTDEQYDTLKKLIDEKRWSRRMVAGHDEVRAEYLWTHKDDKKTKTKRDPGRTFDWARIGVKR